MKENKYDDDAFFAKYSEFPRSVGGLAAAGEWHALQGMLPEFRGRRVLDIGCGFGWHCRYAAEQGAAYVLGTDISEKMLAAAKEQTDFPQVKYRRTAMEDLQFLPNSFDIAISSLAFHYTPDFGAICQKLYQWLSPGGDFVFSVEHPVFTAYGNQDWIYDGAGEILHWPVDRYFLEGERQAVFLGETMIKCHRTLSAYLQSLLNVGFAIRDVVEPTPEKQVLESVPEAENELRRPMMLLVAAKKLS